MKVIVASLVVIAIIGTKVRAFKPMCKAPITDLHKNNEIDYDELCENSEIKCLMKCCRKGEVIYTSGKLKFSGCVTTQQLETKYGVDLTNIKDRLDYSGIEILTRNGSVSGKKFSDFHLVHSARLLYNTGNSQCCVHSRKRRAEFNKVYEDGVIDLSTTDGINTYNETNLRSDRACIEIEVYKQRGVTKMDYMFMLAIHDNTDDLKIRKFAAATTLISSVFLVLTFIVYAILKSMRQQLHNMLFMAYLLTLTAMWIVQAVNIYHDHLHESELNALCYIIGPARYFLTISSYCWLNTLCFDLYRTFRCVISFRPSQKKGRVMFVFYALYAIGVPAMLTGMGLIVDKLKKQGSLRNFVAPDFKICMSPNNAVIHYSYIPLVIVVCTNCALFAMTVYNLWRSSNDLNNFDRSTVKSNKKNKQTMYMYMRLFVLMGVSWIFEVVMLTLDAKHIDLSFPVFCVVSIPILFIGEIIFIMFVCKRSVLAELCKRFNIDAKWTKRLNIKASTRTEASKASRSYGTTKSINDSVQEAPNPNPNPDPAATAADVSRLNISQYNDNVVKFMDKNEINAKRNTLNAIQQTDF